MRLPVCLGLAALLALQPLAADVPKPEFYLFGPGFYFLNDAAGNFAGAELDTLTSPNVVDTPDNSFVFHVATTIFSNNSAVIGESSQAWIRSEFPNGPLSLNEMRVMVEDGDVIADLRGGPDLEVTAFGRRAAATANTAALEVTLVEPGGAFLGGGIVAVDMVTGTQTVVCVPCFDPKVVERDGTTWVLSLRVPPGNAIATDLSDGSELPTTAQNDLFSDLDNAGVATTLNQVREYGPAIAGPDGALIQRLRGRRTDGSSLSLVQDIGPRLDGSASPPLATGGTVYLQDTTQFGRPTANVGSRSTTTSASTEHVCNAEGGCLELCEDSNFQLGQCYTRAEGLAGSPTGIIATTLLNPDDDSNLPQDIFFPVRGALSKQLASIISGSPNQSLYGLSLIDDDIGSSVTRWAGLNIGSRGELIGLNGNYYDCLRIFSMSMSDKTFALECREQTTWNEAGSQTDGPEISALLVAVPPDVTPNVPPSAVIGPTTDLGGNWRVQSNSFDLDGEILNYEWDVRDPDGNVLLQTSTTVPTLDFDPAGAAFVYVTLRVTDDRGGQDATEEPVNTTAGGGPSAAPMASFTEECTWQFCRYTDTSSDDQRIVSRQWLVTEDNGADPPRVVHFSEDEEIDYKNRPGTDQTVTLYVRDGDGQLDSAFVTHGPLVDKLVFRDEDDDADGAINIEDNCLEVPNGPAIPDDGGNVQLDTDADGYGNACDADFTNDEIVNFADLAYFRGCFGGVNQNCDFNGDGLINFLDLSRVKLFFGKKPGPGNPQKLPPLAIFAKTGQATYGDLPVLECFLASSCSWTDLSVDRDGEIVSRVWTVNALPPTPGFATSSTEETIAVDFPAIGSYQVTLSVVDNDGLADSRSVNFEVTTLNKPPIAGFTTSCSPNPATAEFDCTLTSTSTDPDGTIAAYYWDINRQGDEIVDDILRFEQGGASKQFSTKGTEFIIEHYVLDNLASRGYIKKEIDLFGSD